VAHASVTQRLVGAFEIIVQGRLKARLSCHRGAVGAAKGHGGDLRRRRGYRLGDIARVGLDVEWSERRSDLPDRAYQGTRSSALSVMGSDMTRTTRTHLRPADVGGLRPRVRAADARDRLHRRPAGRAQHHGFNESALSGRFTVESDGSHQLSPGGTRARGGQDLRAIQDDLTKRLAGGYLVNPQVTILVEQYRSQSIFVVGRCASRASTHLRQHDAARGAVAGRRTR